MEFVVRECLLCLEEKVCIKILLPISLSGDCGLINSSYGQFSFLCTVFQHLQAKGVDVL